MSEKNKKAGKRKALTVCQLNERRVKLFTYGWDLLNRQGDRYGKTYFVGHAVAKLTDEDLTTLKMSELRKKVREAL